ncbi:MAG: hypothetical protein RIB59_02765 [Rhodospirillales bacterium]
MTSLTSSAWRYRVLNLSDLALPEQVLLYILRKRIETYAPLTHTRSLADLHEVYLGIFGIAHIEAALAAVDGFTATLHKHTRRALRFHRTKCNPVSMDEWRLLLLIAAHQAEHDEYAAALTRWLVPAAHAGRLSRHAASLAKTLERKNLFLPLRVGFTPMPDILAERAYVYPSPRINP